MRIFDKYIASTIISRYIFILLVFTGLHYLIDHFNNLSHFLKAKPSFLILIEYYFYMFPLIFLRVSPFALLLSIVYSFTELNKYNEVISIRNAGLSSIRMVIPVLFFAFFISTFALFMEEKIFLYSQKKVNDINEIHIKKQTSPLENQNFAFVSHDMIFFVRKFSLPDKALYDVTFFKESNTSEIIAKIICKKITYINGKWFAQNVIEYTLDSQGNVIGDPAHWKEKFIPLNEKPEKIIIKKGSFAQYASLKDLQLEIKRLKKISANTILSSLIIDYHQKITTAFSHFFIIIGILPIILEIRLKRSNLSALGVGFIFSFVYYALTSFSIALGKATILLPALSAWLAPIFVVTMGLTGLLLLR